MGKLLVGSTVDGKTILTSDDYVTLTNLIASSAAKVGAITNMGFTATTGSKAITFALKGADGNDPSASNQVSIPFRSATETVGTPVLATVTAPVSIVLSNGSTLGFGYLDCWSEGDSATYVKATSALASHDAFYTVNPGVLVTGSYSGSWLSNSVITNQRFHIDLGEAKVITRVLYENQHNSGGTTNIGAKNFTLWGSNDASAFADTTYGSDTNWTQLTTDVSQLDQHTGSDIADPKYIKVTNNVAYRYYAFKFADNWGHGTYMGVRKIVLQEPEYGRIYLWAIYNAGVVELAVSRSAAMFDESLLVTTTAEGGAGAADSATTMYSITTRTNVPVKCLGYIDITTGAVAGEWDAGATKLQIMGPGVHRSGEIVQVKEVEMNMLFTTSTTIPYTRLRPINTHGAEILTCAIKPVSKNNYLIITAGTGGGHYVTTYVSMLALFRDSRVSSIAANLFSVLGNNSRGTTACKILAGSIAETTFKLRIGPTAAGTIYINSGEGVVYTGVGGKLITTLTVIEIAA